MSDLGAYIFTQWKNHRWRLGGGIRYDHRNVNGGAFYTATDPNTNFEKLAIAGNLDSFLKFPAFSKNYRGVSLSLGGRFTVNDHIGLKVNVARGYQAPNITVLASNGLDPGAHIIYMGNMASQPEFVLSRI